MNRDTFLRQINTLAATAHESGDPDLQYAATVLSELYNSLNDDKGAHAPPQEGVVTLQKATLPWAQSVNT